MKVIFCENIYEESRFYVDYCIDAQLERRSDVSIPFFENILLYGAGFDISNTIIFLNIPDKNSKFKFVNFRIKYITLTCSGKYSVIRERYEIICIVLSSAQSISIDPPPTINKITVTTTPRYAAYWANHDKDVAASVDVCKLLFKVVLTSSKVRHPPLGALNAL